MLFALLLMMLRFSAGAGWLARGCLLCRLSSSWAPVNSGGRFPMARCGAGAGAGDELDQATARWWCLVLGACWGRGTAWPHRRTRDGDGQRDRSSASSRTVGYCKRGRCADQRGSRMHVTHLTAIDVGLCECASQSERDATEAHAAGTGQPGQLVD